KERGEAVDERTDIFSLGVVIYEMMTGRVPFEGETSSHIIVSILEKEPAPLADYWPEVPAELQSIVSRALRKDRQERYQKIEELLVDLKNLKQKIGAEMDRFLGPSGISSKSRQAEPPLQRRKSRKTINSLAV